MNRYVKNTEHRNHLVRYLCLRMPLTTRFLYAGTCLVGWEMQGLRRCAQDVEGRLQRPYRESGPIFESLVIHESTPSQGSTQSFRSDLTSNEAYLMREIRTQMQLTHPCFLVA